MAKGCGAKELNSLIDGLQERLGSNYLVKDRFRQNEPLYKMMKYEKAAIYLILLFVIIIIAFNIFGSLSMLIIEKKNDIETLRSLGAENSMIRRTFIIEGWLISLSGLLAGIIVGVGFALAQQHFGFVKMPGNFLVTSYPIIVEWMDIILSSFCIAFIGWLIALISVHSNIKFGKA